MNTAASTDHGPMAADRAASPLESVKRWLGQAEAWLDDRGRPAWIAAMVLGFIFAWPVGLALLFYMIWSGRMSSCSSRRRRRERHWARRGAFESSGNAAFDAYREETLRRLEEEQAAFQEFMERLRRAKDQAEFDQFMEDRRRGPSAPPPADAA